MRGSLVSLLTALGGINYALALPHHQSDSKYVNWRTFKASGVNLGGWLEQESTIDTQWWATYSGGASDEWGLCQHLGSQCGPVLEHRYATYITKTDIDNLASAGVEILRIPTTYAAWIDLPGSQLYSGNQTAFLKEIADYAITTYGMHIIVDIHSLPGGVNGKDIGEATDHYGWFYNTTALDYSLQAIEGLISFVQNSGSPHSYTIEPINEPADSRNASTFGTPEALSDHAATWVLKYIKAVITKVHTANPKIPVMFQGSFKYPEYWSGNFSADTNLVFDVHNYYFEGRPTTSENLPTYICSDAQNKSVDDRFPVFVGEWAIQAYHNNSLALRARNVNTAIQAFHKYARGSTYWTAKYRSNVTVNGQGTMEDYWNYEGFVNRGEINGDEAVSCS